jgi:hypothetical protein
MPEESQTMPEWVPSEINIDRPNPARIYDYLIGGYHNFEIDRQAAEMMIAAFPEVRLSAQVSRLCLRRMVAYLLSQGIDQYLDIGSGIPTSGHIHEMVGAANPAAHVVYVDVDPVAIAHSQAILQGNPGAIAVQGDLHQPEQILNQPEVRSFLDFNRPIALLLYSTLNYITDNETAYHVVQVLRHALAPGSYLVIGHGSLDDTPPGVVARISAIYARSTAANRVRSRAEIIRFFAGTELVDPGLVLVPLWRPEGPEDPGLDQPGLSLALVGIGYLPKRDEQAPG